MIKLIVMLKKRPDLTTAQFRAHYENSHAVLAMRYFGHLWVEYRRNYPVSSVNFSAMDAGRNPRPDDHRIEFDAVTEIVMPDQAAFDEMLRLLNEPETRRLFSEDEMRFADRDASRFTVCEVMQSQAYIQWPSRKS